MNFIKIVGFIITIIIIICIHIYIVKYSDVKALIHIRSSNFNSISNNKTNVADKINATSETNKIKIFEEIKTFGKIEPKSIPIPIKKEPIKLIIQCDDYKEFANIKQNIQKCKNKKNKKSLLNSRINISKIILSKSDDINVKYDEQNNKITFIYH